MRVEIFVILVCLLLAPASNAWSGEKEPARNVHVEKDAEAPSAELLIFLGDWETNDGEWVDPTLLEDPSKPGQELSGE